MPKKMKQPETRTASKRAASRIAMQQLAKFSQADLYEEPETLEILSEEEVIPIEPAVKKKYKVSHRKSSDGNERDVIVLKTIGWGEQTLSLDTWSEELSPIQMELRKRAQKEYDDMTKGIEKMLKGTNSEVIFEGDSFTAYEIDILPPAPAAATTTVTPSRSTNGPAVTTPASGDGRYSLVLDPRSGQVVGTVSTPATPSTPITSSSRVVSNRKRGRQGNMITTSTTTPNTTTTTTTPSPIPSANAIPPPPLVQIRPTEATAVGGLMTGSEGAAKNATKAMPVVDLTSDDGRPLADSREVSFNKLQGKTFPSLVVVARPNLRISSSAMTQERTKLDTLVKGVLMHPPTKFTEWLIQKGLIKSEQSCSIHVATKLKLGMYSDVTKFPFSGGYVWISECCPQRFVSVFSGSLFEGSPHAPSVLLKLIYHWCCQTNVQNVVQWVKVDNLYLKGFYTWLRSVCTVALHTHLKPLGGHGVKVEIGVISLGTTSQDGNQRQVKVEVLGILETVSKRIRLKAVEPLADNDRNFKKRFTKILEPLQTWVHADSTIVTDLTVDKTTLFSMGFKNVIQNTTNEANGNQLIMDYLRRIVPRMFQNTLSLLSRQIIQQFLDELVWREWYGTNAAETFDNLLQHISEQTKAENQSLLLRLNKVALNPFKTWSLSVKNVNFQSQPKANATLSTPPIGTGSRSRQRKSTTPIATKNVGPSAESVSTTNIRGGTRSGSDSPVTIVDLDKTEDRRPSDKQLLNDKKEKSEGKQSPELPEQMVPLEHYYYGTMPSDRCEYAIEDLSLKCHLCKKNFTNNIMLMKHYFLHAQSGNTSSKYACHYCLNGFDSKGDFDKHVAGTHHTETRSGNEYFCILCEAKFSSTYGLGKHMSREHIPSELPYQCGSCTYRGSCHKEAVDHFHKAHNGHAVVQCPLCLKSMMIGTVKRPVNSALHNFLGHLLKHHKKMLAKKCPKCVLWFIQKDGVKDHQKQHETQRKKAGLTPYTVPRNSIMVPRSIKDYSFAEDEVIDITNMVYDIPDNLSCKECRKNIKTGHYSSLIACSNETCQYLTSCPASMNKHSTECKDFKINQPVVPLPFKMFCVCGTNSTDGNFMAKHLAVCERKSAYPNRTSAKQATVTHSMLDVLGLVRNRPESGSKDSIRTATRATSRNGAKETTPVPEEDNSPASSTRKRKLGVGDEKDVKNGEETPPSIDESIGERRLKITRTMTRRERSLTTREESPLAQTSAPQSPRTRESSVTQRTRGSPATRTKDLPIPRIKDSPAPKAKDSPAPKAKDSPVPKAKDSSAVKTKDVKKKKKISEKDISLIEEKPTKRSKLNNAIDEESTEKDITPGENGKVSVENAPEDSESSETAKVDSMETDEPVAVENEATNSEKTEDSATKKTDVPDNEVEVSATEKPVNSEETATEKSTSDNEVTKDLDDKTTESANIDEQEFTEEIDNTNDELVTDIQVEETSDKTKRADIHHQEPSVEQVSESEESDKNKKGDIYHQESSEEQEKVSESEESDKTKKGDIYYQESSEELEKVSDSEESEKTKKADIYYQESSEEHEKVSETEEKTDDIGDVDNVENTVDNVENTVDNVENTVEADNISDNKEIEESTETKNVDDTDTGNDDGDSIEKEYIEDNVQTESVQDNERENTDEIDNIGDDIETENIVDNIGSEKLDDDVERVDVETRNIQDEDEDNVETENVLNSVEDNAETENDQDNAVEKENVEANLEDNVEWENVQGNVEDNAETENDQDNTVEKENTEANVEDNVEWANVQGNVEDNEAWSGAQDNTQKENIEDSIESENVKNNEELNQDEYTTDKENIDNNLESQNIVSAMENTQETNYEREILDEGSQNIDTTEEALKALVGDSEMQEFGVSVPNEYIARENGDENMEVDDIHIGENLHHEGFGGKGGPMDEVRALIAQEVEKRLDNNSMMEKASVRDVDGLLNDLMDTAAD